MTTKSRKQLNDEYYDKNKVALLKKAKEYRKKRSVADPEFYKKRYQTWKKNHPGKKYNPNQASEPKKRWYDKVKNDPVYKAKFKKSRDKQKAKEVARIINESK